MPGLVPGIYVLKSYEKEDVDGRDEPGHDGLYLIVSHQRLAAGEGRGFRNDPSVEQIQIDIAAAQHQAYLPAPDFLLVLQGRGERRGAGALRKVMRIGPERPYRQADLAVGHLH